MVKAENDAALVEALRKHYLDAHRRLPMTEDKIREHISAKGHDA